MVSYASLAIVLSAAADMSQLCLAARGFGIAQSTPARLDRHWYADRNRLSRSGVGSVCEQPGSRVRCARVRSCGAGRGQQGAAQSQRAGGHWSQPLVPAARGGGHAVTEVHGRRRWRRRRSKPSRSISRVPAAHSRKLHKAKFSELVYMAQLSHLSMLRSPRPRPAEIGLGKDLKAGRIIT